MTMREGRALQFRPSTRKVKEEKTVLFEMSIHGSDLGSPPSWSAVDGLDETRLTLAVSGSSPETSLRMGILLDVGRGGLLSENDSAASILTRGAVRGLIRVVKMLR
jgi:hypothetical protein